MSVDHAQWNAGDDPESDLDELLTLAAELAGPEEQAAAWERRNRYSGDRMRELIAEEQAAGGRPELLGRNGRPRQRARVRAAIAASVGAVPMSRPRSRRASEGAGSRLPSIPLGRWRLPIAVGTAAATAAAASAIALHTWGPDRVTTPYTSAPLVAQGEAGGAGIWPQPVYMPNNGGSGRSGGSGGGAPRIVLPVPAVVQAPSRSSGSSVSGSSGGSSSGSASSGSNAGQQNGSAAQSAPAPARGAGGGGAGGGGGGSTAPGGGGASPGGRPH